MARVTFKDISKWFGEVRVFENLNLTVAHKELLVLLGPSGSGKSTLLNIAAGLEEPTAGELYFDDQLMNDIPPEKRNISMVFQSVALYPHLNVRENITFTLRHQKLPRQEIEKRLMDIADMLDIRPLLRRNLMELSGGERQRAALGKALVRDSDLFLLDEPFTALDATLRRELRSELLRIHRRIEKTVIFVTHDQEEAMVLADRVVVIREGEVMQAGRPSLVYHNPDSLWVAQFIGNVPINFFPARLKPPGLVELPIGRLDMAPEVIDKVLARSPGGEVVFAIRPEFVMLETGDREGVVARGEIATKEVIGKDILYLITVDSHDIRALTSSLLEYSVGERVGLRFSNPHAFFFQPEAKGHERIRVDGTS